jgi:cyclopropane-fatty-acyl-phospholipid synthase
MSPAVPDRRALAAVGLLARVFARLDVPLTFRLWDGTTATVGTPGASRFAIVLHSAAVLRRLLRRPTPLRFGEAFIAGDLDIDGDVFAAMDVANHIEHLQVPLRARLAAVAGMLWL